jgi:polar amino acid transport system substrate-binding protein
MTRSTIRKRLAQRWSCSMFRTVLIFAGLVLVASCATGPQVTSAVIADLAPTGKLRAGINYGNPLFTSRDPKTGEGSGIAVDLAREFGRRLGVPVELVGYNSGGQLTAGLKSGGWDVAILAFEQGRTGEISFSAPFAETDATYLVHAGSPLRTAADVDQKGVRIAVSGKGGNDLFLTRTLRNATLVRMPTPEAAFEHFVADKLDAYANLKPALLESADKHPGLRVVDGRYTVIGYSAGVPKGRDAGAKYLSVFIEDAKASGLVAKWIEKSGIRGIAVAPKTSID